MNKYVSSLLSIFLLVSTVSYSTDQCNTPCVKHGGSQLRAEDHDEIAEQVLNTFTEMVSNFVTLTQDPNNPEHLAEYGGNLLIGIAKIAAQALKRDLTELEESHEGITQQLFDKFNSMLNNFAEIVQHNMDPEVIQENINAMIDRINEITTNLLGHISCCKCTRERLEQLVQEKGAELCAMRAQEEA